MKQRRYPGATPFTGSQSGIFYGRDRDIEKLLTLIKVEKKVLLYSKSGLGKTSLLEAGVLPKLPDNFITISIRLFAYKPGAETPLQRVINALKSVIGNIEETNDPLLDSIVKDASENKTLWYYFKKAQRIFQQDDTGEERIFTLVFDQFEELFSFPKKDIDNFKNQLHELTALNIPDRFAMLIAEGRQKDAELFSRRNLSTLHKKMEIKVVFAIRSDRLSLLNNLSDKLPDIQQTFYELQPLTPDQARQAIEYPARDPGPGFESPPFSFHPEAIKKIINELSDEETQIIETTQLQIVCHRIEEIAAAKTFEGTLQIEVADLPKFSNIFLDFYFDSINRLAATSRDKAKRLIEDELIRNRLRISLDEELCKEYLAADELRTLVDTHLLRAERNSFGRFSFEVSHDTLVDPILESQKKYKDELENIKRENERREELRKLKVEQIKKEEERRRQSKRQRTIIYIIGISLVISIGLGLVGYFQMLEAKEQKSEAEKQERIAKENFEKFLLSEFTKNFKSAQAFEGKALYTEAIKDYGLALEFAIKIDSIAASETTLAPSENNKQNIRLAEEGIKNSRERLALKENHDAFMKNAANRAANKEYIQAMSLLDSAYKIRFDTSFVKNKMDELYRRAIEVYKKDTTDYAYMNDTLMFEKTKNRMQELRRAYQNYNQ
jgi:hypothetical protein